RPQRPVCATYRRWRSTPRPFAVPSCQYSCRWLPRSAATQSQLRSKLKLSRCLLAHFARHRRLSTAAATITTMQNPTAVVTNETDPKATIVVSAAASKWARRFAKPYANTGGGCTGVDETHRPLAPVAYRQAADLNICGVSAIGALCPP